MAVWNRPGDDDQDLARTEGVPVPGVDLVIVTQNGKRAEPGEEGEVRVRGPQLMKGYVDAALDAEAFDEQGFFRSGDLEIISAGQVKLRLKGVREPESFQRAIQIAATAWAGKSGGPFMPASAGPKS